MEKSYRDNIFRVVMVSNPPAVQRVMDMVDVLKFHTPKFLTIWHRQTVQTQIRLLL